MKIHISQSAEIALSTLGTEDRQRVSAWFQHLQKWRQDPSLRALAKELDGKEKVFTLRTNPDLQMIFRVQKDTIEIMEILRPATLSHLFAQTTDTEEK